MTDKQNEVDASNSKKLNGFTVTAIVMVSIGFWLNPLCILSVMGIVFGGIGLSKHVNTKNKTWATISLVMGIIETLFWLVIIVNEMAAL